MNLYTINALQPLVIGRQNDNLVMEIRFDCAVWSKENPALTDFRLEITSPKGIKYIPAEQQMDGSVLVWTITNTDTAVAGEGEYEIIATGAGGEQQASAHAKLYISDRAAGTPGVMPDYEKPLLDQMAEYAQRAEDAAEKAESTGGLPENSIPFQMLVSDGADATYWFNRLAYDYPSTEILPETTLSYNNSTRGYPFFTDALSDVVIGKAYAVTIDNKYKYVGIARNGVYGGMPCIGFGNPYILNHLPNTPPTSEMAGDIFLSFAVIFPPGASPDGTVNGIFVPMPGVPTENITLSIHLCEQKKLDKRFLPDDIGGGLPEGGEPYKQLVTDGEGNAVWEERLAYEEPSVVVLQKAELDNYEVGGFLLRTPLETMLVVGNTYTVTHNDKAYACKAIEINTGETPLIVLGNADLVMGTGDTGEPFVFVTDHDGVLREGVYGQLAVLSGDMYNATLAITAGGVKKIDPKFLPDGYGGGTGGGTSFDVDETLTLENGILSVNTADVVEADNTLPVTSAAVQTTVGNINALLETI